MCVFINSLIDLEFIQLLKYIIVFIKFIFTTEKTFPKKKMKISFKKNLITIPKNYVCVN